MKQSLQQFWHSFTHLPSAWLLCLQLLILILSMLSYENLPYRAVTWMLGVLVLLVIAKVIRQTPMFTILGLSFVAGAILFSSLIVLGLRYTWVYVTANLFEASAYFSAAYGLLRYMFHDRYLTKDELFAAGAVFTLLAWGFAFLYSICQLWVPYSFSDPDLQAHQPWLDLIFLSFSVQSATGLSDVMPVSPLARMLAIIQMFVGVMYLALIVSRLIALHYISHLPKQNSAENQHRSPDE
ncbi:two pore domain potassium channel family protein [Acinetobacter sp. YH12254]|uniref:two pore domain potassium channel family protein n=1 Tax=Acinetobacter sp. YH12254 TaxID=2601178 RepID=UPI0015D3E290|nr:two pore domain potassium channel family protein [Acinetobacter sp. YH12254]